MSKKARITIEIECTAPEEFFEPNWKDISKAGQDVIAAHGPLPCEGGGNITSLCTMYNCPWAEETDWDSELL